MQNEKGQKLFDQILKFPKIDLHRHLDGSIFPKDLFRIVNELNIQLTDDTSLKTLNDAYNYTHEKRIKSFDVFVDSWEGPGYDQNENERFNQILSRFTPIIVVMQYKKGLYEVSKQVALDLLKENIYYAEFRFAPIFHITKEMTTIEEVLEIVWSAFQEVTQQHNIVIKIIASHPSFESVEKGLNVIEACAKFNEKFPNAVVAIDVACGSEDKFPAISFKKMYEKAKSLGLKATIHSGESKLTGEQNIQDIAQQNMSDSLKELKADGLGHAISLPNYPNLLEFAKQNKIRIESNPISNSTLNLIQSSKDLKLDVLLQNEILTINSDDCAMWKNGSLTENILKVLDEYNWTLKELEQIQRNTINLTFATSEEKKVLQKTFEQKLEEFNNIYIQNI